MRDGGNVDDGRPIFAQVAEQLEGRIIDGSLPEAEQVPSINELAKFYRINPATALKGINVLVDQGMLYKQRGIGMFVAVGARALLLARRKADFQAQYVAALVSEARRLGMSAAEIIDMVAKESVR
jgi:DNA-binding transcriptional regulator YhcF (GntR family)